MGRRVKKAVYAYGSGAWELQKEILFVYDGWDLVQEKEVSSAGDPLFDKFYVWGLDLSQTLQGAGGIGGLVCRVSGGEVRHYFYDANGNVGQMVNPSDGSVTARYEYDPFGNAVFMDGADAVGNVFRFSTKYWDQETDLVYFGYRYYLSELGRWVSQDPIEERGGKNLFSFVLNNPLSESDYLGLYIEEDEKQYEYTAKNGIAAHKLIMKHVDIYYNGEPIDDISSTEWDLKFDQPLNILGLGFSNRRPDIISETICRKLIWEIKPITHIKRFDLLEKDYDQMDGYLSSLNDHSYYYGEAIIFFPTSNLTIGVIEGEKDIKYEVKVISNHDRIGLIFYKLEKIWWDDDNPFDHWKKELEKGPNPLLYLILSLLGGSSGIAVPMP